MVGCDEAPLVSRIEGLKCGWCKEAPWVSCASNSSTRTLVVIAWAKTWLRMFFHGTVVYINNVRVTFPATTKVAVVECNDLNPYYRLQLETRQRLTRYGIRGYQDAQNDFYSLKYVKIDPQDLEDNPILKKASEHWQAKEAPDLRTDAEALEEELLQEMRDTI